MAKAPWFIADSSALGVAHLNCIPNRHTEVLAFPKEQRAPDGSVFITVCRLWVPMDSVAKVETRTTEIPDFANDVAVPTVIIVDGNHFIVGVHQGRLWRYVGTYIVPRSYKFEADGLSEQNEGKQAQ